MSATRDGDQLVVVSALSTAAGDRVVAFPRLQQQAIDWMELNRHRHMMYGLIEADVTDARRAIKSWRTRTGRSLSLTTYVIFCFARAVAEDPAMQAYRMGRQRMVLFGDVDVGIMVERQVDGARIPVPYIIRRANCKSLEQLQDEIRDAQSGDPDAIATASLPRRWRRYASRGMSTWLALPAALRRAIWRWALQDPYRRRRLTGTVGLTAVGMFGRGTGWGIAPMAHSLTLIVGGLATRPGLVSGCVTPREVLCLTIALDHDVIDGAPAARFANRLVRLLEDRPGL